MRAPEWGGRYHPLVAGVTTVGLTMRAPEGLERHPARSHLTRVALGTGPRFGPNPGCRAPASAASAQVLRTMTSNVGVSSKITAL